MKEMFSFERLHLMRYQVISRPQNRPSRYLKLLYNFRLDQLIIFKYYEELDSQIIGTSSATDIGLCTQAGRKWQKCFLIKITFA